MLVRVRAPRAPPGLTVMTREHYTQEAELFDSVLDVVKTDGIFLGTAQYGEVCTVCTSVSGLPRTSRVWISRHYFFEPFVSGRHVFSTCVLHGLQKPGFFLEGTSRKCFVSSTLLEVKYAECTGVQR